MTKFLVLALTFLTVSQAALAGQRYYIKSSCTGSFEGKPIKFYGYMPDVTKTKNSIAQVIYDGQEVARFNGSQLRFNIITQKAIARNSRGDYISGRLAGSANGIINKLEVPAHGLSIENLAVKCKKLFE